VALFNAIVRRELPKLGMVKFGLKKLESRDITLPCGASRFRYLDPHRHDSRLH